jgi:DNA-directed RNA polymerase subunit alpha
MPEGIVLDEASHSGTFGRFIVQPLERGFGVTIGNAFRRVLLSSIPGAAVTAIKINGVLHEFSTVPGVVEDVSEIILNLKGVRLKLVDKKLTKVNLELRGPGEFTAADLQEQSSGLEVLNPKHHIATLNDDANFEIELRVARGKGYVPAEENKAPDQAVGVIPIDSIFTPIRNVRYSVEDTRVGQRTDYEKLSLEIETDGSIAPVEALTFAANVLREHIQLFINFDVEPGPKPEESKEGTELSRIRKILEKPVEDLELSVRSQNCLKAANIRTMADLVKREEADMLKFRNFGRKSLAELTAIIEEYGLTFGWDINKYLKDVGE